MPLDCCCVAMIGCSAHSRAFSCKYSCQSCGYLALYALPCAHVFRFRDTTRFIPACITSSPDRLRVRKHASHSFEPSVTRRYLPMVSTSDLRLAIMPTGSVVCMRRPPMRDVGTCPMTEATYLRNTRPSMRIDESVARFNFACGRDVCVCCVAVGQEQPKFCLVMTVNGEATGRHTLASLHMPTYASEKQHLGLSTTDLLSLHG